MDNYDNSISRREFVELEKQLVDQQLKAFEMKVNAAKLEAEKSKQQLNSKRQFLLNNAPGSIQFSNRKALGSVGSVGDFYNANIDMVVEVEKQAINEQLHNMGAFKTEPVEGAGSNCTIGKPADLDRCFMQLGIGAEQKASIIVGLTAAHGYAAFLDVVPAAQQQMHNKDGRPAGTDDCQFTLFQSVATKRVGVQIFNPEVAHLILNPTRIDQFKGATHIVQTVHYGCAVACVFKLQPESSQFVDLERVKQIIKKRVKDNYHTEVDWNYLKSVQAHFSVQLFANEQTLAALGWKAGENSLAKLLKKIQTSRLRANLLLGNSLLEHPLAYDLVPLAQLVQPDYLVAIGTNTQANSGGGTELLGGGKQTAVQECVKQWQAAGQQWHRVLNMFQRTAQFGYCLPEHIFTQLSTLSTHLDAQYDELTAGCRQLVKGIRSGMDVEQWRAIQLAIQFGSRIQALLEGVRALEEAIREQQSRLDDALWLERNGVPYVGRNNTTLALELAASSSAICFALFSPEVNLTPESAAHYRLLRKLLADGQKCIFVDLDLAGEQVGFEEAIPSGLRLVKFRDGRPQSMDYLWAHARKLNTCIAARPEAGTATPNGCDPPRTARGSLPPTLIPLEIPVPCANFVPFTQGQQDGTAVGKLPVWHRCVDFLRILILPPGLF